MSNGIWIGLDPGSAITGYAQGELKGDRLEIFSEALRPTPKYAKDKNTRTACLRNALACMLRRIKEPSKVRGVCIEDPMGVRGNANILHELVGAYICAVYDTLGSWDVPIYRVTQPALKKFAINKSCKRDEAIMLMSRRAYTEYNFAPLIADEIMAFWCMMFGFGIWQDPVEKFRLETIGRFKKSNKIE